VFVDFVLNGQGHGPVAQTLQGCRFDSGLLRPYKDDRGTPCCTVNTGRRKYNPKRSRYEPVLENVRISDLRANGIDSPVFNATSLRKEQWLLLDRAVLKAARLRLKAWQDLANANTYGGFNGMSKLVLEHETASDPGEAHVDMEGVTEGRTDSPKFQLEGLPLPITHSDFFFTARRLAVSQNSDMPLDATMGEAAGRRCAESVEKVTIGVQPGITYGGNSTQVGGYGRTPSVYGYTNFPNRITKHNLTVPTGANAAATISDVLAMRDALRAAKFYGPYMLYTSNDWDKFLDGDYILTGGAVATQTLRQRLKAIEDIQDVRRLDFLAAAASPAGDPARIASANPFTLIMVQMTSDVARAVVGQDITTVQWPTVGGMKLNFKVFCILVPQLRADFYGNCGVCHATTT
jgi:hypothetical protein